MSDDYDPENLSSVLRRRIDSRVDLIRVSMPGRITSYNRETRRACVQPMIMDWLEGEDGIVPTALPVLQDVPLSFLGSGGYRVSFPIAANDEVLLVMSSSSLAQYKRLAKLVDPLNPQRHKLEDAIAIPVMITDGEEAPEDALVIEVPDGKEIRLGGVDADDPVVRKSDLAAFIAEYNAHKHTVPILVGSTTYGPTADPTHLTGDADNASVPTCSPVVKSK